MRRVGLVGVLAALALGGGDGRLWLRAEILSTDGSEHVAGEVRFAPGDDAPEALAADLLGRAPPSGVCSCTGASGRRPVPRRGRPGGGAGRPSLAWCPAAPAATSIEAEGTGT